MEKEIANKIGNKYINGTETLFASKAKWLHTWVACRSLPYLGFLAFIASSAFIYIDSTKLPPVFKLLVALLLMLLVLIRNIDHLKNKNINKFSEGYRLSVLVVAIIGYVKFIAPDHLLIKK